MTDDLRDRLTAALASEGAPGPCFIDERYPVACGRHDGHFEGRERYCNDLTGQSQILTPLVRDEIADELDSVADRLARIVTELIACDPENEEIEPFARFCKWLRMRAEEVRCG